MAETKIDRTKLSREIRLEIEHGVKRDPEVKLQTKAFAEEVRTYWATQTAPLPGPDHPYATGDYAASIKVRQNRDQSGRYAAGWTVYTNHPNANFIEFGTGPDKPGSRSPWGPYTPTAAMHSAARAAIHFKGTAP